MGLMRFLVGDWDRIPEERLARVFIAGSDELPYPGRAFRSGDQLIVERRETASGSLWAPWPLGLPSDRVESLDKQTLLGEWLIGTASLMERDRPYLLEVELARGVVYRLRNQLATWQQLGLESNETLNEQVLQATKQFSRAATQQQSTSAAVAAAEQAILAAAQASIDLAAIYAKQAMDVRRETTERLPTLLGVSLRGDPPPSEPKEVAMDHPLAGAVSTVALPCAWNSIEASEGKRRWKDVDAQFAWAQQAEVRICAGPLMEFQDRSIPDWAYLWEGDFESLATLLLSHVESVVSRYRGRVQLWNVAGRINRSKALGLTDEQRLQLVARAMRIVRETDPKTPAVVSFDQPWGDYLTNEPSDLAPIDFADALERAELGIAGFGLEINLGYAPDGTTIRSPLDFSRLLDYWSLRLELPLLLQLTLPSSTADDSLATHKSQVVAGGASGGQIDAAFQARWVEQYLPMLLAKNCVQVVIWNDYRDDQPHLYPHGGLIDAQGKPKPTLDVLRQLREAHLV